MMKSTDRTSCLHRPLKLNSTNSQNNTRHFLLFKTIAMRYIQTILFPPVPSNPDLTHLSLLNRKDKTVLSQELYKLQSIISKGKEIYTVTMLVFNQLELSRFNASKIWDWKLGTKSQPSTLRSIISTRKCIVPLRINSKAWEKEFCWSSMKHSRRVRGT